MAYDARGAEGTDEAEAEAVSGPAPDPVIPEVTVADKNVPLFLKILRPSAAGQVAFPLEVLGAASGQQLPRL